MIVLSAGMQKSGTGWYYNMTNDLLVAAGGQDARVIREKYRLESVLRYSNCQLASTSWRTMARVTVPHVLGNSFVVKTHNAPTDNVRRMMAIGVMKATYIYRDPRDVVLSALDHGAKIREGGEDHTFGQLHTIEDSILYVKKLLGVWHEWMQTGKTHFVRYEDVKADPRRELERLSDYLRITVSQAGLQRIADAYQAERLTDEGVKGSLHFNQGVIGRYKHVMSPTELELCATHFGSHLSQMGYSAA